MKNKESQEKEEIQYFDEVKTKGRSKLILNQKGRDMVTNLAKLMCTDEEIASVLNVCVDTLTNKNNKDAFSECKKRGQQSGKASLRRMQYKAAENGNVSMLIWLGKQYLDQKDQIEASVPETSINVNVSAATAEDMIDD